MKILNNVGEIAHQGDIFITKIAPNSLAIPKEQKITKKHGKFLVVAQSETLGNSHVIEHPERVELIPIEITDEVQRLLLRVKESSRMLHVNNDCIEKGHDAIVYTPGDYELRTQREKRGMFLRRVVD